MNKKLQDKLYKKYPKIFKQKNLPMSQTCMCWGIECEDGWYFLIDTLCSLLQWDIDHNGYKQIEAMQVKEKYGTLRFYTNIQDDKQSGMISFAEYFSSFICEKCGSNVGVKQTKGGWIYTRCKKCMEKL